MDNNIIPESYHLIWSDEFTGDSPHVRNWNYEIQKPGRINGELQEYIASDKYVCVKNGELIIRPEKTEGPDGKVSYYSGRVNTFSKHDVKYGRIEAMIKVPKGKGLLPGFQMLPKDDRYGRWPESGCINVMEIRGDRTDTVRASVEYGLPFREDVGSYVIPDGTEFSDGYHIFTCEWEPGKISFFVDGKLYHTVDNWFSTDIAGKKRAYPTPFDMPFYLVFYVAVGGTKAGEPDEDLVLNEDTAMHVKYVRVYRKDNYEEIRKRQVRIRKTIAICGVWEDADNLNLFLRSMLDSGISDNYLLECFTFGIANENPEEVATELEFADFVGNMDHAAIILFGEMLKTQALIDRLKSYGLKKKIPVFMFERYEEGCINAVMDYKSGFREMVEHVVKKHGIRDVDMFAGFRGNAFSEERIDVYKQVLEENGIPFEEWRIHYGDFWDAQAFQVLSGLISSGYKLPKAFICANDSMAIGVCDCLKQYGYKVPDDIIVTGFDGVWQGECHNPSICTCKPDIPMVTSLIGEKIRKWDESMAGETDSIGFDFELVPNHSCGCLRAEDKDWSEAVVSLVSNNQDYFRHVLEMGRFISRTIGMSDVDEGAKDLEKYLWLWKWQYYFIGINEPDETVRAIFHGRNGEYKYRETYRNVRNGIPDIKSISAEDSDINILLFKQIREPSRSLGYIVEGFQYMTLRFEQRFEEFSIFVSAMVNAVLNNRQLMKANEQIENLSETDYLTGIYNRRGFFKKIESALADIKNKGRNLTMVSLDMDGLKTINDNYGHYEGDIAITTLAHAIKAAIGEDGICARYGGDEFAFAILRDESAEDEIETIRKDIEQMTDQDEATRDKPYKIRISIGASSGTINRRLDIEAMIREADEKMYEDKQQRRI
ncbi:MAG: diguanylate cyclase [Clostridiales bacterium]|nr:diguanylate cyclase [Clostridiales bacterium]